jgi:hypothetical protein
MAVTRSRYLALALFLGLACFAAVGLSQQTGPNERYVKPEGNVQDADANKNAKDTFWVLDFKFKDPRLIKVNVPGRGQQVCWYLWYQVINYPPPEGRGSKNPVTFIPDFELVTHDTNMVYKDQIMPTVQAAIARIEDPTGYYKLKNSVTMSLEPIPPTLPKSAPRAVTGVAIWTDPNEITPADDAATKKRKAGMKKLADSNRYSIFVSGLSNGWAITDPIPPDTKPVVRRKTLQLNFRRIGDKYMMKSEEIRFVPPAQWIYRGSTLNVPLPPGALDKQEKGDKDKDKDK